MDSTEAIQELAAALFEAMSPALMFGDYTSWNSLPSIHPFASLSPTLAIVDRLVDAIFDYIGGRPEPYYRKTKEIMERVNRPDHAGFEGAHYQYLYYALNFILGFMEASMGLKSALDRATALETSSLLQVNAWQIRELYYLWQGIAAETLDCKRKVETLQIQNSPSRTWFGMVLRSELRAYCLADDLSSLRNAMHEVEKMTFLSSAWIPTLHYAKGEYHRIRGDYESAIGELKKGLQLTAPGRHQFWAPLADAYLRTLLVLRRDEQVLAEAGQFLQSAEREKLGYMGDYLKMSLAIAQARSKDINSTVSNADAAVESFERNCPARLNLGLAYEVRARVATLMDDETSFIRYLQLCVDQYRTGGNGCLIAKYEKLAQEARQAEFSVPILSYAPAVQNISFKIDKIYQETRAQLDQYQDSSQRVERAFAILMDSCNAKAGYLFGLGYEGLKMVFSTTGISASEQLLKTVNSYLEAELKDSDQATITEADENSVEGSNSTFVLQDGARVEMVLLRSLKQNQPIVVGVAALIPAYGHLSALDANVVYALCDTLLENDEVIPRAAA